MKKYIFTMLLTLLTATVQGQPNQRLKQLDEFLQQQGIGVSHKQTNAIDGSITHMMHAYLSMANLQAASFSEDISEEEKQRVIHEYDSINALRRQYFDNILDSIRITFATLGKDASENYMYEYHKNGVDTISYSLAFLGENDTLQSSRLNNLVIFGTAREAALFDYHKGYSEWFGGTEEAGNYNHYYSIPTGITWNDMQPFDTIAFNSHIQPVLKRLKTLKGAKTYPVYWRHDEGFKNDDDFVFWTTRQSDYGDNKHTGLTTGIHYFIPSQHKDEAEALYRQLDSLAYDYVNSHPRQTYSYNYTQRFPYLNLKDIVKGHIFKDDREFYLSCMCDEDGNFHILTLNNKGELWVPRDWQKLKSYINGDRVYLKGMEPKKDN